MSVGNGVDDIVSRAAAREAELQRELEELRVFLAVYRKLTGTEGDGPESAEGKIAQQLLSTQPAQVDTRSVTGARETSELPPQGMRQGEFEAFTRQIMLEHGRPMQPVEILKKFHEKGRHVGGTDEAANLKSKLWRGKKAIINIPGSGYWPIEIPCPAVSYVPPEALSEEDSDSTFATS